MFFSQLHWFSQPVAFYGYTSRVSGTIIEIDATYHRSGRDNLTDDEKEIIEYIEELFNRAARLNRHNGYCSTRRDNKIVIEMSDGASRICFGYYDHRYFVGLRACPEYEKCRIDLLDITPQEWSRL